MRNHLAILAAKTIQALLRRTGSDGGALPGLIAGKIAPNLSAHLVQQATHGVVLVAGTNGKTTTTHLLTAMLAKAGLPYITNRSGSNMARGHLSALLANTTWRGELMPGYVVLEVDEAVLPQAISSFKPSLVIWNNLFRDQLDRYGEVDSIAKKWLEAVRSSLPVESTLLINADDPLLVATAQASGHANTLYFGFDSNTVGSETPSSSLDAFVSPVSGLPLSYTRYYVSHLGNYFDLGSTFKRPPLDFAASHITAGTAALPGSFTSGSTFQIPLPGLYNIYNALAACAAAEILSVDSTAQAKGLAQFTGVFGRFERLTVDGQELILTLIKNPAGAGEVVKTILADPQHSIVIVAANDNFADGLDVSWYWDTDFEALAPSVTHLTVTGSRALDMALRWKYAEFVGELVIIPELGKLLKNLPAQQGRTYILATYTAMLDLQHQLTLLKIKPAHWKE